MASGGGTSGKVRKRIKTRQTDRHRPSVRCQVVSDQAASICLLFKHARRRRLQEKLETARLWWTGFRPKRRNHCHELQPLGLCEVFTRSRQNSTFKRGLRWLVSLIFCLFLMWGFLFIIPILSLTSCDLVGILAFFFHLFRLFVTSNMNFCHKLTVLLAAGD